MYYVAKLDSYNLLLFACKKKPEVFIDRFGKTILLRFNQIRAITHFGKNEGELGIKINPETHKWAYDKIPGKQDFTDAVICLGDAYEELPGMTGDSEAELFFEFTYAKTGKLRKEKNCD